MKPVSSDTYFSNCNSLITWTCNNSNSWISLDSLSYQDSNAELKTINIINESWHTVFEKKIITSLLIILVHAKNTDNLLKPCLVLWQLTSTLPWWNISSFRSDNNRMCRPRELKTTKQVIQNKSAWNDKFTIYILLK